MTAPLRPPKFIRALAVVAAALALGLTATACDSSPYAASINSQVIKQIGLTSELKAWAGNQSYVTAFNQANSSSSGGSGVSVVGDAPDTYNTSWVANILTGMIDAAVVHQHLASTGNLPGPAVIDAARAVSEGTQIGWYSFPASFRTTLVERLAERSMLTSGAVPPATVEQAYKEYESYFFTAVCAIAASAPDQASALQLSLGSTLTGTPICYDQTQVEAYPLAVRNVLMQLAVGQLSQPLQLGAGYEVLQVTSRTTPGLTPAVSQVLSTAIAQQEGTNDPIFTGLVNAARVKINPAYGTWSSGQVQPPQLSAG